MIISPRTVKVDCLTLMFFPHVSKTSGFCYIYSDLHTFEIRGPNPVVKFRLEEKKKKKGFGTDIYLSAHPFKSVQKVHRGIGSFPSANIISSYQICCEHSKSWLNQYSNVTISITSTIRDVFDLSFDFF